MRPVFANPADELRKKLVGHAATLREKALALEAGCKCESDYREISNQAAWIREEAAAVEALSNP
ncbi:MAG: hypothetical protein ACOYM3_04580 [Terrimicrobiaceae bacterium]